MAAQAFESKDSRESPILMHHKFSDTFRGGASETMQDTRRAPDDGSPLRNQRKGTSGISNRIRASGNSTYAVSFDPRNPPTDNRGIDSALSCVSFELGAPNTLKSVKEGSRSFAKRRKLGLRLSHSSLLEPVSGVHESVQHGSPKVELESITNRSFGLRND